MENKDEIVIYQDQRGETKLEVTIKGETVWLNRNQMALLFNRDVKTIGKHINNIFKEGELVENSVVANFATTATDNKKYQVEYYNLDVIISVGYRVKSLQGTQFRIWATGRLKEYIIKGFALNDDRFKSGYTMSQRSVLLRTSSLQTPKKKRWENSLQPFVLQWTDSLQSPLKSVTHSKQHCPASSAYMDLLHRYAGCLTQICTGSAYMQNSSQPYFPKGKT